MLSYHCIFGLGDGSVVANGNLFQHTDAAFVTLGLDGAVEQFQLALIGVGTSIDAADTTTGGTGSLS